MQMNSAGPRSLWRKKNRSASPTPPTTGSMYSRRVHAQPGRNRAAANRRASQCAKQFPPAREIAGEEEREQQPNGLDRLQRPEIDLGRADARSRAEHQQQQREDEGAEQREIAELERIDRRELDERDAHHQDQPDRDSLRVAHEEQAVAQRVGTAQQHSEADRRQQVNHREEETVSLGSGGRAPPRRPRGIRAGTSALNSDDLPVEFARASGPPATASAC